MNANIAIQQFVDRVAPDIRPVTAGRTRHTFKSLARFLNVTPEDVEELCCAELLCADEPWPGAPSLAFCNRHLYKLRHEIAFSHAQDALELVGSDSSTTELNRIFELSWKKRTEKVTELTSSIKATNFAGK